MCAYRGVILCIVSLLVKLKYIAIGTTLHLYILTSIYYVGVPSLDRQSNDRKVSFATTTCGFGIKC